ncbi:hypothetical protein TrVE_jg9525 [Triparma verrucosa]|uniref:Uncharacterized protein n=1 Tax=Triparma verrucosa TaxID=1606542 RepID=A0A9W7FP95_9STRA|nr:hypothetical protein TrVE_jg9525 [Triparma verrucosa]
MELVGGGSGVSLNFEVVATVLNEGPLFYFFTDTPDFEIVCAYVEPDDDNEGFFIVAVADDSITYLVPSFELQLSEDIEYTIWVRLDGQGTLSLFVDGVLLDSTPNAPQLDLREFKADIGSPPYEGSISEFSIWIDFSERIFLYEWDLHDCDDNLLTDGLPSSGIAPAAYISPNGNTCGSDGLEFDVDTEAAFIATIMELGGGGSGVSLNFEVVATVLNEGPLFYFFTDTPDFEIVCVYEKPDDVSEGSFIVAVSDDSTIPNQDPTILKPSFELQPSEDVEYTIWVRLDGQGTLSLFVDGVLLDSTPNAPQLDLREFKADIGSPPYEGSISKFSIWIDFLEF